MRAEAKRWTVLWMLLVWCVSLLALRVERSESLRFVFLAWNLFLAWLPLAAGRAFRAASRRRASAPWQLGWLALWLLFLPNAPYILTDLLHLRPRPPIPLWYDLALLLSCAGAGLLLGYLSLLEVQAAVEERFGGVAGWTMAAVSLLLSGFGIYLGRFLRWNSWEVVTAPAGLFRDVADRLRHPFLYPRAYAVTLIFGTGLLLGYTVLRALMAPRGPLPSAASGS